MRSTTKVIAASLVMFGGSIMASLPAQAQGALATVIHGINGSDLGATEDLPVDIAVDGGCALTAVPFRAIARDVPLPTGPHEIEVFLNDPAQGDCGGTLAVTARIDLAVGENATVIAHLNQSGAPALTKVSNNAGPLDANRARLSVVHAAVAPAVDVLANKGRKVVFINSLSNGQQSYPTATQNGRYHVRIRPDFSRKSLVRTNLKLEDGVSYTVFAVGTLDKGSFELIVLDIQT